MAHWRFCSFLPTRSILVTVTSDVRYFATDLWFEMDWEHNLWCSTSWSSMGEIINLPCTLKLHVHEVSEKQFASEPHYFQVATSTTYKAIFTAYFWCLMPCNSVIDSTASNPGRWSLPQRLFSRLRQSCTVKERSNIQDLKLKIPAY